MEILNVFKFLPNKISSFEVSAIRVSKTVQYVTVLVLGRLKNYYSNIDGSLLKKLLKPPDKFILTTIIPLILLLFWKHIPDYLKKYQNI